MIKNKLKEILYEKNISQNDLCLQTGLSKGAISNIVNNKQNATLETALDIAKYLNVSVEDIFYKTKDKEEAIEDFNKLVIQANELYKLYQSNSFSREDIIVVYNTLINNFTKQYDNMIIDMCQEIYDDKQNPINPLFEKVLYGVQ
jgi:putative transcriptional regulator